MTAWIETKNRLPDERSTQLEFTDGRRTYKGYYKKGQFFAETPPAAENGTFTTWHPEGIIRWRQMADNELY